MKRIILGIVTFFGVLQANPKVVAKFGQGECPWSEQMKQEVWNSSSFQALLEGAGIERDVSDVKKTDTAVPAFVLYSEKGEEIGSLGYLLISPEKYVDLLKEMLSIHTLCKSLSTLDLQQLLSLYRKAQVLHMTACEEKLLQEGLMKDPGVDFLIEKYAKIVKAHPRKARKIKEEIRLRKPDDIKSEWELALLSFQARKEKMDESSKVVVPLEKFLKKFEAQNQDYGWRCHLVLAEFYRDKHQVVKAKFHAQIAAKGAPDELKSMILALGEEGS